MIENDGNSFIPSLEYLCSAMGAYASVVKISIPNLGSSNGTNNKTAKTKIKISANLEIMETYLTVIDFNPKDMALADNKASNP